MAIMTWVSQIAEIKSKNRRPHPHGWMNMTNLFNLLGFNLLGCSRVGMEYRSRILSHLLKTILYYTDNDLLCSFPLHIHRNNQNSIFKTHSSKEIKHNKSSEQSFCLNFTICYNLHILSAASLGHHHFMAFLEFLRIFKLRRGHHRVASHGDLESSSGNYKDSTALFTEVEDGFLRQFSWVQIEKLTENFSQVVGSGGFSTVYLGNLSPQASCSTFGAFKIVHQNMKQEIDIQLHLRHPHIVKLIGYCPDQEMEVLVFEYMANGTLQEKLHGSKNQSTLSWKKRMAIAYQLASAIEYLHESCSPHIVHGDIKASNILLDNNFNCKLCDFGSAKLGFSSSISPRYPSKKQPMMGSPGYVDPHYFKTGISSKKNDIYSFGVILLELITGMEAFCAKKNQSLISVAGQVPATRVSEIVDPRLEQDFNLEEAKVMASISAFCLESFPSRRPAAGDILQTMKEKISSIFLLS